MTGTKTGAAGVYPLHCYGEALKIVPRRPRAVLLGDHRRHHAPLQSSARRGPGPRERRDDRSRAVQREASPAARAAAAQEHGDRPGSARRTADSVPPPLLGARRPRARLMVAARAAGLAEGKPSGRAPPPRRRQISLAAVRGASSRLRPTIRLPLSPLTTAVPPPGRPSSTPRPISAKGGRRMASAEHRRTPNRRVKNKVIDGAQNVAVRRYFTIPGREPFEEVEWEVRDALIPGKEKPVFDQKGVEFPKFWSQTATNIVAQKFFRGPHGLARPRVERPADDRPHRRDGRRTGAARAATSPTRTRPISSRPS